MVPGSEEDVGPLACKELQGSFDGLVVVRDVPSNYDTIAQVVLVGKIAAPASFAEVLNGEKTYTYWCHHPQ